MIDAFLIKIQYNIFLEINILFLKFIWKCKAPVIANITLKEKNRRIKVQDYRSDFKVNLMGYYNPDSSIKTNKLISRIEQGLDIDPHT